MTTLNQAVDSFLSQDHIAVAGVSRSGNEAANLIYRKLREIGFTVYATNPNAGEVEGDPSYPDLKSIPGPVDGVVIATHPSVALGVAKECADLGVEHVWFHRSFGQGSVDDEAVVFCREKGMNVIPAGCPMMFVEKADFGHKCMRWLLSLTGGIPKEV